MRGIVRAFVNPPIAAGIDGKGRRLRQCRPGAGEAAEVESLQRTVAGPPDWRIPGPHLMLARAIDDNDTIRSRKCASAGGERRRQAGERVGTGRKDLAEERGRRACGSPLDHIDRRICPIGNVVKTPSRRTVKKADVITGKSSAQRIGRGRRYRDCLLQYVDRMCRHWQRCRSPSKNKRSSESRASYDLSHLTFPPFAVRLIAAKLAAGGLSPKVTGTF